MSGRQDGSGSRRVAVIGGGLAGLAAAVRLVQHGGQVTVFEARRHLGGRAGSFLDPESGEWLDHCQHVAMGCCTEWESLCHETDMDALFRTDRVLHFFGTDRRYYQLAASTWLPAPYHLLPGLLRLGYLSIVERWGILRTLHRLRGMKDSDSACQLVLGAWLLDQRQTGHAIEHFWSVVILSALSESVDRVSVRAARQVFVDGFMATRRSFELHVPIVPLSELYDQHLANWLRSRGARIHLEHPIRQLTGDAKGVTSLRLADGTSHAFEEYVLAVPWWCVRRVMSEDLQRALPAVSAAEQLESSSITAVHLWFDRPITSLPHAVLVGGTAQWVFRGVVPSEPMGGSPRTHHEHYYQVVISASQLVAAADRSEIVARVCADLAVLGDQVATARLLRWRVVEQPRAVFAPLPGSDAMRPQALSPVPNLSLAGDWTATGWPATMESAVRSGNRAAACVLERASITNREMGPVR